LTLANGMTLRSTPDHPIFTQRGWVNAKDLAPNDFVAVARELPCGPLGVQPHQAALLGYALSEGSLGDESHFYLYSIVAEEIADMAAVLGGFANTAARIEHRANGGASSVRPARLDRRRPAGAVQFLFEECGLRGKTALTKRVPTAVDRWDRAAVAVLVAKLFQGDGCVHLRTRAVYYATSSPGLADDVRRLLLKLGVMSTVHRKRFAYRGGHRPGYTVNILGGRTAYLRLHELIGTHLVGAKRSVLAKLAYLDQHLPPRLARGSVDVIPTGLYREPLREAILKRFPTLKAGCRELGLAYRLVFGDARKLGIRRETLAWLAMRLDAPALYALAESRVGWSRPRSFVTEGIEPTYDFEVPGAHSFIGNGVAVHNSHAAAYALVAYQTAYFKANYPVEFMAALLTSEMGDTDKIVKYIEECRSMGLQVEPPDVNRSAVKFSVAGDTIRFGLAAIKNVGEAAMESILAARDKDGPFTTLEDFCTRVDLRLVNRRVVESLIKAGAFDGLRLTRRHLSNTIDGALESGQRQQRERAEGQGSFFDLLPPAAAPSRAEPVAVEGEWEPDELLQYEKEVLGFYVSGHPLARYGPMVESLGITSSSDLAGKSAGSRVLLFGQVAAIKETATKSGNRMAFVTLEDIDGTVEVTVFPEPFKVAAELLRRREPLLVRGRLDESDKGRVVLAEDVRPLAGALGAEGGRPAGGAGREPNALRIRVPGGDDIKDALGRVREICGESPGGVPVFLHLLLPGQEVVVRSRGVSVDPTPDLLARLQTLLGPTATSVDYAGSA
jgi:DNA polymerase-3 subunit alpha